VFSIDGHDARDSFDHDPQRDASARPGHRHRRWDTEHRLAPDDALRVVGYRNVESARRRRDDDVAVGDMASTVQPTRR